jgi:hypothetical protein
MGRVHLPLDVVEDLPRRGERRLDRTPDPARSDASSLCACLTTIGSPTSERFGIGELVDAPKRHGLGDKP